MALPPRQSGYPAPDAAGSGNDDGGAIDSAAAGQHVTSAAAKPPPPHLLLTANETVSPPFDQQAASAVAMCAWADEHAPSAGAMSALQHLGAAIGETALILAAGDAVSFALGGSRRAGGGAGSVTAGSCGASVTTDAGVGSCELGATSAPHPTPELTATTLNSDRVKRAHIDDLPVWRRNVAPACAVHAVAHGGG